MAPLIGILPVIKEQKDSVGLCVAIAGKNSNEQGQLYSSLASGPSFGNWIANMGSGCWTRWVFQFDPARSYFLKNVLRIDYAADIYSEMR